MQEIFYAGFMESAKARREKIIEELIAANPGQAASVKEKPQAIGWFVGQVMKATGGKANPAQVNELLQKRLPGP